MILYTIKKEKPVKLFVCPFVNHRLLGFFLVLTVLLSLGLFDVYAQKKTMLRVKSIGTGASDERVKELQAKIGFIKTEIDKVNADLMWLSGRIKKMEAFKQFIPQKMYDSVKYKESKIQILTKLMNRYKGMVKLKNGGVRTAKTQKKIPPGAAECGAYRLEKKIRQTGLADWLEVVKNRERLNIENTLPILFASGSSAIAPEYQSFLKELAAVLKGCHVRIFVDGYADTDPIRTKKYPSNFELGAIRAANVAHALIYNGLNPGSFKIGSTGQYRFADHKASEWKALERHVNIRIELH